MMSIPRVAIILTILIVGILLILIFSLGGWISSPFEGEEGILSVLLILLIIISIFQIVTHNRQLSTEVKKRTMDLRNANSRLSDEVAIRTRTENLLRHSESRYRNLFQRNVAGVYRVGIDGIIDDCNDAFARIFGFSAAKEIKGKNIREFYFDPDSRTEFLKDLQNNAALMNYEIDYKNRRGEKITASVNDAIVSDEDGNPSYIEGTMTDITERKKAEDLLVEKNNELNTFMYKASHDLRGPLASIIGLTNVAVHETDDHRAHTYFKMISESTVKLDSILTDLVDITKVRYDTINYSVVDLKEVVKSILKSLEHKPGFDEVDIQLKFNSDLPEFYSDPKLMSSILQNLIDNAIKYRKIGEGDSTVFIEARNFHGKLRICIKDNGIGIAKNQVQKVFDMFYRGTETSQGSGLGLYIVKNAVDKLRGTMVLNSSYGDGSEFILTFPILKPGQSAVA